METARGNDPTIKPRKKLLLFLSAAVKGAKTAPLSKDADMAPKAGTRAQPARFTRRTRAAHLPENPATFLRSTGPSEQSTGDGQKRDHQRQGSGLLQEAESLLVRARFSTSEVAVSWVRLTVTFLCTVLQYAINHNKKNLKGTIN